MANIGSEISQDLTSTFTSLLSGIKSERITDLVIAIILAVIGFLFAKFVSNAFIRAIGSKFNPHQQLMWRRGIYYSIFIFFIIAALKEAGLNLSLFLGAAGILTVAIGFASQTSASNLISGLFLIGEGSFEVGDIIQVTLIRGHVIEGEVLSIDLLSVKLLTLDNVYIRLPNEQLIRTPVQNLSKFPIRRVPITLSINFDENLSQVRAILIKVASQYHLVLEEPKPTVTVTAFRESSIELLFAVWCRRENFLQVRDEMQELVRKGFVEHHINIAVPKITILNNTVVKEEE